MTKQTSVNWEEYIGEFLGSGMTIKEFAKSINCAESALKYHLYKDPRYSARTRTTNEVNLIPIRVDLPKSETIQINGFDIGISATTGDEALAKVLSAIRRIS